VAWTCRSSTPSALESALRVRPALPQAWRAWRGSGSCSGAWCLRCWAGWPPACAPSSLGPGGAGGGQSAAGGGSGLAAR
jgi:hypothetical protein